jgi:hypothetical protein
MDDHQHSQYVGNVLCHFLPIRFSFHSDVFSSNQEVHSQAASSQADSSAAFWPEHLLMQL